MPLPQEAGLYPCSPHVGLVETLCRARPGYGRSHSQRKNSARYQWGRQVMSTTGSAGFKISHGICLSPDPGLLDSKWAKSCLRRHVVIPGASRQRQNARALITCAFRTELPSHMPGLQSSSAEEVELVAPFRAIAPMRHPASQPDFFYRDWSAACVGHP